MPNRNGLSVTLPEAFQILAPYVSGKFLEQAWSVLPIVFYLAAVQFLVLRQPIAGLAGIAAAIAIALVGLMFFMEGLRLGLMPLGEDLGAALPTNCSMKTVMLFSFVVGILATLAEPAIGTLRSAGGGISPKEAPLLAYLLGPGSGKLVIAVGIGVGAASLAGIQRLVRAHSLAPYIYPSVALAAGLSVAAYFNEEMAPLIGLAWDCGAVTTGPVTVPLVLSLGIGVSRATGRSDSGMAGFGIVTLASLFPIIGVLSLGFIEHARGAYLDAGLGAGAAGGGWRNHPAVAPLFLAIQAIVPLVLFLLAFQRFGVRKRLAQPKLIAAGIFFALFGMALFNLGLSSGLTPLGEQIGRALPGSFHPPQAALYGVGFGIVIAVAIGFFMGYGATLAEPALNALGAKVEEITVGAFRKPLLMHAVALGVGIGIALGVAKFVFGITLLYLILGGYLVLLVLTSASRETFVNIGWDSAGVTTGPVTVPLVIAMGLGIGGAVGVVECFGILSLASIFPIMTVLALGLTVKDKAKQKAKEG